MSSKLRILFITYTHSNGGGAEAVLTNLVNNIDRSKYVIDIFELIDFKVKKEPINDTINLLPALYSYTDKKYIKKTWLKILETNPAVIKSLKRLNNYDIVITWDYQKPSFMLPCFLSSKNIAWFHSTIDDLKNSVDELSIVFYETEYYFNLQKKTWSYADKIITISNKALESLNIFPEFIEKARIIHNAFDIENVIRKSNEVCDFNFKKYNFPFLICIGRLDRNKNFSLVIKSLAKLNSESINCGLIIIGQGEEKDNLVNLTNELNISNKVFFLGYKKNPYPYILNSKLLCLSSFAEGFPTVVCESMTLGKPFITTPVAGASDELSANETCGLVSDWNVEEYTKKIKLLLADKKLYNELSFNCKKKIQEFSLEKTIQNFYNLLNEIPEKKRANDCVISKRKAYLLFLLTIIWNIKDYKMNSKKCFYNLKNNFSIVNISKFIYRFSLFVTYIILFPIRFCFLPFLYFRCKKVA